MNAVGRGKALVYAIFALLVGAGSYLFAVRSGTGQSAENSVLHASDYHPDPGFPLVRVTPQNLVIALVAIGIVAWILRGFVRAVWILLFSTIAIVASQLLKQHWLERPSFGDLDAINTFPSGHMTVLAVLATGMIWALPAGFRGAVAVMSAVLLAIASWQLLAYSWHRPSDVLGGQALCVLAFALAAVLRPPFRARVRIPGAFASGLDRFLGAVLTLTGSALIIGGLVVVAIANAQSIDSLLLGGAQLALCGSGTLVARAAMTLGR